MTKTELMMQIECVACGSLNHIPKTPTDENQMMLCYDCDKQLAWGKESPATRQLLWSIEDDCPVTKPTHKGKRAISYFSEN